MDVYEKNCEECHRKFRILSTTQNDPGCIAKEVVWCPYCHHLNGYFMTSGDLKIEKIEEE